MGRVYGSKLKIDMSLCQAELAAVVDLVFKGKTYNICVKQNGAED
jgi:hypothetical protein